jgi:hypothetical protein
MGEKTEILIGRVVKFPETSGFREMSRAKTLVGQHWFMGNNTPSTGVFPANHPGLLT